MSERFSFYKGGIWVTKPTREIDIPKLKELVSNGTYKVVVEKIRSLKIKEAQREFKRTSNQMDYVTIGGTFHSRGKAQIATVSGLCCVDIDDIKNVEEMKRKLMENKFVHFCFISPSGKGLKVVAKIPPDATKYEAYFISFANSLGIKPESLDTSTKDISRACFLSYDSEPYYNPDSEIWVTRYEPVVWQEVELQKDRSRSGYEFREVVNLLREGKSEKEVKEIAAKQQKKVDNVVMWEKWRAEGTHYHNMTLKGAQTYVRTHPAAQQIALERTFDTPNLMTALKDLKPKEWIIEGLFPKIGILYLSGAPKSFKSMIAFYTALCLATGRDWFEQEKYKISEKKKILIIQEENDLDMLYKIRDLAKGLDLDEQEALDAGTNIFVSLCNRLTIDTYGGSQELAIERLKAKVVELQPDIIIFDSTVRMLEGDENKASDVRKIETTLKMLMKEKELLCIMIHHLTKKGDGMRGSGDFIAQADTVIELTSNPKYNGLVYATIPYNRGAPGNFNKFHFRVYSVDSEGKRLTGNDIDIKKIASIKVGEFSKDEDPDKLSDNQETVWEWITIGNRKKEFQLADIQRQIDNGAFPFKKRTLLNILAFLCEKGKLQKTGLTKQAKYFVPKEIEDSFVVEEEDVE